jgi:hypothetical protein
MREVVSVAWLLTPMGSNSTEKIETKQECLLAVPYSARGQRILHNNFSDRRIRPNKCGR